VILSEGSEQFRVDLALQVANIAAQVSTAMRSKGGDKRDELESRLALAHERLQEKNPPPGLVLFIEVMRGLLRGENVAQQARGLPPSYLAVYEQLVGELTVEEDEGQLTVRQVIDEVTHNVIAALQHGSFHQRRQMANTLFIMEQESERRPDLVALRDFLTAARLLLEGGDPSVATASLRGPFLEKWQEIVDALT
jgi:hypothetical protein